MIGLLVYVNIFSNLILSFIQANPFSENVW